LCFLDGPSLTCPPPRLVRAPWYPTTERTTGAAPTASTRWITVGVDTHKDRHVAAAVDQSGRLLASTQAPTTVKGCKQLLAWAQAHGRVDRFGIEGTGAYGAGLARFLRAAG
jgi:transposase